MYVFVCVQTYIRICTYIHPYSAVIRGEPGENAVFCTGTMTYELRVADTSNTLLLIPSLTNTQEEGGRRGEGEGREGGEERERERERGCRKLIKEREQEGVREREREGEREGERE